MSDTTQPAVQPLNATTEEAAAGLGAQVRAYDETFSVDDAIAAEIAKRNAVIADAHIAQQQDPTHDQSAFKDPGRPVPPHGSGPATVPKPRTPFLSLLATDAAGETKRVEHVIENLEIRVEGAGGGLIEDLAKLPEQIMVEGKVELTYLDPILHRMVSHGETAFEARLEHGRVVVIRELMWIAHNIFAHPIAEITHWLGYLIPPLRRFGLWLHDLTVPPHAEGTGRG